MVDASMMVREQVLGAELSAGKFAFAAIGLGFLAIAFSFVPIIGIIIGLLIVAIAWKYVKGGTSKYLAYMIGAVMIAASFTSWVWGNAATANTTSAGFKAAGGVWSLFGYALWPVDGFNSVVFGKPAITSWWTYSGTPTGQAVASVTSTTSGGPI